MDSYGFSYVLFDAATPEAVRYVGQTRSPRRLAAHLREARGSRARTHKANWIRQTLAAGGLVEWRQVADAGTLEELNALEAAFIKRLREEGHRLTNATNGGD